MKLNRHKSKRIKRRTIYNDGAGEKRKRGEEEIRDTKSIKLDNCIRLHDQCINKISGPVSLTILKPTDDNYRNLKAPIFILFGDIHWSNENLCNNCVCSTVARECCYPIYSYDFLKLIDKLGVDSNYPVHFSTEMGLKSYLTSKSQDKEKYIKSRDSSKHYPLPLLTNKIEACYSKELKEKNPIIYDELCPTKNIIWNAVDTRDFTTKDNFSNFLGNFFKILYHSFNYTIKSGEEKLESEKNLEGEFGDIIYYNYKYFKELENYLNVDDIICKIKNKEINSLVFKQFNKLEDDRKKIFGPLIIQFYKEILNEEYEYFKENKIKLQELLKKIIDFIVRSKALSDDDMYDIDTFNKFLIYIEDVDRHLLLNLRNIVMDLVSTELDLYFLLRSFKTPKGSKNPLISIGYFGNAHVKNISLFLKDKLNYEEVYYQYDGDNDRCLEIKKHIDLNEIIKHYKDLK
jgi:hypothetical protein